MFQLCQEKNDAIAKKGQQYFNAESKIDLWNCIMQEQTQG